MQAPNVSSDVTRQKGWPKNGRALSNVLRRLAPTLRALRIAVTFDREPGGKRQRLIRLVQGTPQGPQKSQTPGGERDSEEREQAMF